MVLVGIGVPAPAFAPETVLVIDGRGNGHGVGMAQDGALAMGRAGADVATILQQFYPGTSLSSATGIVPVRVLEGTVRETRLVFTDGGEVRVSASGPQPPGYPVVVGAGGAVTIAYDGSTFRVRQVAALRPRAPMLRQAEVVPIQQLIETQTSTEQTSTDQTSAEPGATEPAATEPAATEPATTTTPSTSSTSTSTVPDESPPTEPPPSSPAPAPPSAAPVAPVPASGLWLEPRDGSTIHLPARDRRYRGAMAVGASAEGGVELVNHVDVETYLKGMGEVRDPTWPAAGLQTQAVAARTYALRAVQGGAEICDDDRCQVYLGAQVEYAAMNQAVSETAGKVLKHQGALASTFYSASAGGVTATPEEGFGSAGSTSPYLVSAPYPAADPAPWNLTIGMADVGPRLDYPGRLSTVAVSKKGPSGRATEVTLDGDAGPKVVTGVRFAARLGLRSTLFAFREEQAAVAPIAPAPLQAGQAPLDDVSSSSPQVELPRVPAWFDVSPVQEIVTRAIRSAFALAVAALFLAEGRRRQRARRLSPAGVKSAQTAEVRPAQVAGAPPAPGVRPSPVAPASGAGRRRWSGRR